MKLTPYKSVTVDFTLKMIFTFSWSEGGETCPKCRNCKKPPSRVYLKLM